MADDELTSLLAAENRRHFDELIERIVAENRHFMHAAIEGLRHDLQLLAEAVTGMQQAVEHDFAGIVGEVSRTARETQAIAKAIAP